MTQFGLMIYDMRWHKLNVIQRKCGITAYIRALEVLFYVVNSPTKTFKFLFRISIYVVFS